MKHIIIISVIFILLSCSIRKDTQKKDIETLIDTSLKLRSSVTGVKYDLKKDSANMDFIINPPIAKFNRNNIIVNLEFNNKTDRTILLLNVFDPLEIFFTLRVYNKEGKSFAPLLGGFIDFPHSTKMQYIEIQVGQSFVKELNVSSILKAQGVQLDPGKYNLEMSYFNYHGEDCIKGRFKSNIIELNVTE